MRLNIASTSIGTVVAIRRYPVKSMQAEALDAAELHWTGLHGDRHYAFCRAADSSDFPWLTGRTVPELVLHSARYADPLQPRRTRLHVVAPDGAEHDIMDPALTDKFTRAADTPVRLLRLGRGAFDAMPVSVIATTTGDAVDRAHGAPVGLGRFRSNLVICPDDPAETERDWLGRTLVFGDGPDPPGLRLDWLIPRCAMVAIDPGNATRDPSVLRTVVQRFGNQVGAYCAVQAPGMIRVGDRVWS